MPEGLKNLLDKVKDFWNKLEKGQKTRIFIIAGVLIAAVAITLALTLRVEYVALFKAGEDVELQPVVDYLTQNNIKFKKGENQIYVDSKKKSDIEFDLTTQGIVSPEVTFSDTWNQLSLTATEADKTYLWKNYVTNNLIYKLKKFENVEDATVEYYVPEKTYWARPSEDETQQKSAFVMLKSKKTLTTEQVDAAAKVVAASLGIPVDNITIVDKNLNPLMRSSNQSDLERVTTQDEMRRQRQKELEAKVYDHFKIGIAENDLFDTLSVSANAVLDFDTLKSTSTKYEAPDEAGKGYIKNSESLEEHVTNGESGDIPGTDTNPETAPTYQMGGNGNSQYDKTHNIEERIYNQTNEETEKAVGKLVSEQSTMSISLWYGKRIKSADALTEDYLNQVKQAASTATGVPVENITVSIQKLAPEEVIQPTLADTLKELFDHYGFYALMLILLVIMVITAMPKKQVVPQMVQLAEAEAAVGMGQLTQEPVEEIQDIHLKEQSELKKQIEKFVQQNPDAVAQLLRNWIAEDWE